MKWNDFTSWLRKSSTEYESKVDVEELWSGMEASVDALNNKGGARNTILALAIAGLVLSGGIVAYLGMNSGDDTTLNVPVPHEIQVIETTTNNENEKSETSTASEQQISEAREEAMKDQFIINNVSSRDLSNASSLAKDKKDQGEHLNTDQIDRVAELKDRDRVSLEAGLSAESDHQLQVHESVSNQEASSEDLWADASSVSDRADSPEGTVSRSDQTISSDAQMPDATVVPMEMESGEAIEEAVSLDDDESQIAGAKNVPDAGTEELQVVMQMKSEADDEAPGMAMADELNKVSKENLEQGSADAGTPPPVAVDGSEADHAGVFSSEDELAMASTVDAAEVKTASLETAKPISGKKKRNLCPNIGSYKGKKWTYLAGVEAGAAYPFQKMTTSAPETDDLFTFRSERETSMAKINYGFAFTAIHPSGFNLSSGFGFSNLLERYEFTGTKTETEMIYGVVSIAINPLGDTVYTMGDIPVTTTTQVQKKIYNKYNYFEIPVLIGYQKEVENWSFGVQGGVTLGLITSAVGQISDENGDEVSIFDLKDELFRSKFSANYYLGGKVSYNTRGGLSIYLSPNVRFAPHDVTAPSYPVSSKYIFAGGSIGVAYQFGR